MGGWGGRERTAETRPTGPARFAGPVLLCRWRRVTEGVAWDKATKSHAPGSAWAASSRVRALSGSLFSVKFSISGNIYASDESCELSALCISF